jgi:sphingolipid delta-4 desaturase
MSTYNADFQYSKDPEPHVQRTKNILKKYPEIRKLMGRNPSTIYYIFAVVGIQILVAWTVSDFPWWGVIIAAYLIGAFANHALFVLIHETTHNLIFKNKTANLWAGILCDLPNAFPGSIQFRKYHLKHHAFQGNYDADADLPALWEAKMVKNSTILKAIWLLFYPIILALRPQRLIKIKFNTKWVYINVITVLVFDIILFFLWGPYALLYLFLSLFFSVGLHPVGGRWIQEHYLVAPPQETYSYYGPLNKISFNVGFHNEHHDFSFVPWNNLPKIRAMAPEFYNDLHYHTSWSKLLWQFLTDHNLSLYSRVVRDNKAGLEISAAGETDYTKGMQQKES